MPAIVVVAAVIEDAGRFLLTRRLAGTHLEGLWEFPGGKCHAGESHEAALRRELREELDADASIGAPLFTVTHAYPDRSVELHFYACELHAPPRATLGQEMRWVTRAELATLEFPPADTELIARLVAGDR
jgi:mutator protein MutT